MTPPSLSPVQGRLCILLAAVLWSAGGALTKLLREPTPLGLHLPELDPLLIAAYRVLFAGLVFVPFLRKSDVTYSPWMLFTAAAFALMNASYITAVASGSAANAILLQNSAPLWLYLVGVLWLGEKSSWRGFGALVLGMTGIGIIVASGWSNAQLKPALLALASGLFYACILIGLRLLRASSSLWVTTLNHLVGAVVLLPFVWHLPWPNAAQFVTLVLFGALQLGLPYYLTAQGLRVVGAQEAGTLILLEPLLNPVWAYLVSPETETPSSATLVGGAFLLGALLYRYWPTRSTPASEVTMSRTALVALTALGLLAGSPAYAQLAPSAGYAVPAGGKAGTTVEVRLGGADWTPDLQFLIHNAAVKLEVTSPPGEVLMHEPPYWFGIKSFASDPPLPREVAARFVLPANLPPGPVHWRVANASGGSVASGIFMVGVGTELVEDERTPGPQTITTLPATVSGRLRRIEEVDRYRFTATQTGPVTCDLMARRMGSEFHGVLTVSDATGRTVAEVVDTEGIDPVLTFVGVKGQTYTVAVRDLDYRGYRSFTYRLTLTPGPRVQVAIPAAGKRGEKRAVEFVGIGVATGSDKVESVVREVPFPTDATQATFAYRLETPFGAAPDFPLHLSNLTETVEPVSVDPEARRLTPPGAVTARLTERDGKDVYTLAGKKGDTLRIVAEARRFGSRLDPTLAVVGPDGKEVGVVDGATAAAETRLNVTLPADGVYRVVVGDVSGTRGTPVSSYRLQVEQPAPDFRLAIAAPTLNVPLAGTATLTVNATREGGHKEPIVLSLANLPLGITLPANLTIPATANTLAVVLTCAKDAPAVASLVQVMGTAKVGDQMATRIASSTLKSDLAARDPVANKLPTVLVATTLKPPFKVKPVEADGGRRVARGATHLAELLIERSPGFTGEIHLDMAGTQSRHRQGIRGPVLPVAPNVAKVMYPVWVPECLETTRTSRIAVVAMAKVPDGKGTLRHVLAAAEGQITLSIEGAMMKLTHAADELTVRPGQPFDVTLKLSRIARMTEAVKVELLVPPELTGLVTAAPLTWPANKDQVAWTLMTKDDPRLVGAHFLTARAIAMRDGHPVMSETMIEVEFTGKR